MDYHVSLAVLAGKPTEGSTDSNPNSARQRALAVQLGVSLRFIIPTEIEKTATMLRVRSAVMRIVKPNYRYTTSDFRLKFYSPQDITSMSPVSKDFNIITLYKYRKLPSDRHIRVLQLQPGPKSGVIKCCLDSISLDDTTHFMALSYAWGSTHGAHRILCDGAMLLITLNLHEALLELRSSEHTICLWVDAICIDQSDDQERNAQVNLMGEIYSKASEVCVWLGNSNSNSDSGLSLVQKLCSVSKGFAGNASSYEELEKAGLPSADDEEAWRAFEALYWRPWWTRTWVIQEICLSQNARFRCGSSNVRAQDIFQAASFVTQSAVQTTNGINTGSAVYLKDLRQSCLEGLNLGLLRLLFDTRSFHASDKRDKIYALLGLCGNKERIIVNPDYLESAKDLYQDLTIQYIKQGSLDILSAVCDPFWRNPSFVPSWVPDWSTMPRSAEFLRPSNSIPANATKNSQAEVEFLEEDTCLSGRGFRIDTVSKTDKPFLFPSIEERIVGGETLLKLIGKPKQGGETLLRMGIRIQCWERCALRLKSSRTDESPLLVFLKTIIAGDPSYDEKERDLEDHYVSFCLVSMFKRRRRTLTDEDYTNSGIFSKALFRASSGRTLFFTKEGFLGIGPYSMRSGDKVVILKGGKTPYILRDQKNGFSLVGECYVHGIMHGEALKDDRETEVFKIR